MRDALTSMLAADMADAEAAGQLDLAQLINLDATSKQQFQEWMQGINSSSGTSLRLGCGCSRKSSLVWSFGSARCTLLMTGRG